MFSAGIAEENVMKHDNYLNSKTELSNLSERQLNLFLGLIEGKNPSLGHDQQKRLQEATAATKTILMQKKQMMGKKDLNHQIDELNQAQGSKKGSIIMKIAKTLTAFSIGMTSQDGFAWETKGNKISKDTKVIDENLEIRKKILSLSTKDLDSLEQYAKNLEGQTQDLNKKQTLQENIKWIKLNRASSNELRTESATVEQKKSEPPQSQLKPPQPQVKQKIMIDPKDLRMASNLINGVKKNKGLSEKDLSGLSEEQLKYLLQEFGNEITKSTSLEMMKDQTKNLITAQSIINSTLEKRLPPKEKV